MTNTQIIFNSALSHGFTEDELSHMMDQNRGDLPFHTVPEWSRLGYHVKADAAPLFDCYLWKHTSKPSAATIKAAQDAGKDAPDSDPHFYQKLSYIYGPAQVEKNAAAPDLATIKAQLDALPGIGYKVKGEKTGAPNVWIIAGADAHADAIKAMGGIWSKKKAAYWIKPGTATAATPAAVDGPAPMQARPAYTLPPVRLALPAPKANPGPAPAPVQAVPQPRTPGPWKKCSFYTIRNKKTPLDEPAEPAAELMNGFTDGIFNYYSTGMKSKTWCAIYPAYGLAVSYGKTRKAAQSEALAQLEKVREIESKADTHLTKYAAMIQAAQNGGNVTLAGF